jgi:hypothetical protein
MAVLWLTVPWTFWALKRWGVPRGILYVVLGGMMWWPEGAIIKFPMMPEFDKHRIVLVALIIALVFGRMPTKNKAEWWWYYMITGCFLTGVAAWLFNSDPIQYGPRTVLGITFKDGMYVGISEMLGPVFLGFFGMRTYRSEKHLDMLVTVLACAGLIYAVPVLIEVRMTPQVHRWIYGYHANANFTQMFRFGGYRPQVCMAHGLGASLFVFACACAATLAARTNTTVSSVLWKWTGKRAAWALVVAVIVCKSTGVYVYSLVALPLIRWFSAKTMMRTAVIITTLVCAYPYLRITQIFPKQTILDYAAKIEEERMHSLKFRFDNEDILIEHALKRPWFGWGGNYGRNRVYSDWGDDLTVTDGGWIIAFGSGGYVGLILYLGLPAFSVFTVARRLPKIRDTKQRNALAGLALALTFTLLDVLPNGSFNWLPFFLGGALCGISKGLVAAAKPVKKPKKVAEPARRPVASPAPAAAVS